MIYIEGVTDKPKKPEHILSEKYHLSVPVIRSIIKSPFEFSKEVMLGMYPYKTITIDNFGIFSLRGFYYTDGPGYDYITDYHSAKEAKRKRATFFKARRAMLRTGRRTREIYVEPELLSRW
jgi:hypothetical protein